MAKASIEQFKYTEHERKPIIRNLWCLPQIEILYKKTNKKLTYIGLPGIEALDIKAWLNFLSRVIAFQCSEYNEGSSKKTIDVIQLDNLLEQFERADKLQSSIVYEGYMEDIIMGGLSDRGQIYTQEDFLKIYNLDFCNNISAPRVIRTERGKNTYYTKLQVIEKLLDYQKKAADENKGSKFIMYLTVNSNVFNADVSEIKSKTFKDYSKSLTAIKKEEVKNVRLLKAYCFYVIQDLFNSYGFTAEFLPPIFYRGSSYPNQNKGSKAQYHRMMTFTILGARKELGKEPYIQDESLFLSTKFLFANGATLSCFNDALIEESDFTPNAVELLQNSHTFRNLW